MHDLCKSWLLKADENGKYFFDRRVREEMCEAMTKERKQNVCDDAAYILYNRLPKKALLTTYSPQHEEFWKRYFRHAVFHSYFAKLWDLKMSGYSAVVAIGAAR